MTIPTTWVLLCNGYKARVAAVEGAGRGVRPIVGMTDQGAGREARALVSDGPAVALKTDKVDREKQRFAHRLAEFLTTARKHRRFDRLVLVAPPDVLQRLHEFLPPLVERSVVSEIDRDMTGVPMASLGERIEAMSRHQARLN